MRLSLSRKDLAPENDGVCSPPHPWLLFTLTVTLTNTIVESHTEGVVIHTGNMTILNRVLWFHNDERAGGGANHIVLSPTPLMAIRPSWTPMVEIAASGPVWRPVTGDWTPA